MVRFNLKSYLKIIIISGGLVVHFNASAQNRQNALAIQQFTINGSNYQLEIAQTRHQLQIGLMGRSTLPSNRGMLFVFPNYRHHAIWMKNMSIPLTVAWLDKRLTVIAVHKLMPCKVKNCPITKPAKASAYVLELNINDNLSVGDRLLLAANK